MDSLDKNDSPNLTSLMEKLSQSELTSILELLQNKTSEEVTGTLSKFGNTLNCLIGNIHVMSEYDLIHWCCSIKLLTNTLQSSEKQVLARLKYIKDSYRCAKCKRNAVINYDMGLLANLQSHSCNPPPSTGAQCLEARLIKKLKEYELYRTIRYDKSVEELFYKVTVDNAETICFYSVTSTREGVFTCLVCGRDVSGRQNIIQHVFGNKHIGTIHEDYAIILAFHTCFSRLERKYQMLQMNFRYRDEKKVECLMCSKMVHFQNMKSHMDGPCFKLGNDAQNYKFIIKYHQLVEDTIYKDLLEYYVVVSNYRCPILQHIDGRIYCILCNATVNKHICIHIDSKAHQQSLSSTHMLQLLKRYHQIWAAQPIHVQIEQIYFRKREHKITCTVCSNYLSYDSAMLTQHVDSVDHKRFLMKATEIRTSSSNLLKQGPESVSSRSTSVETDRNASLSTSSSSSDIGNRIVANSTMADVPSPPTPNSPVSRNLSETATLIPYDETVLDDLYSDGLVHFIVTIGSTKYPTIIKREACKYCLLCNVDITTTVLLHANSPQHVEAMTVDRRCELLKKFHELWIRLPQTDQCRQVLFTIEEDLVCSLCNQKMSYDVDEVKSHLESWEHVQKLMVTRTNATVQEPTFSQAANNGTVPDSPRKIDDKISEETPKTPTEKVKLLQDLLSGFKFTSPSENKTNTTVTKNAERKFDNSSTKPAVPVNYSQETLDELYSEELIHYHVRIGNIRYPFIQNMGTYKRCLICNIDLINSILFHVNSPPHVAMLNNPKKMEQLKSYHDLWLNFSEPYQREQKYFEVGEKLSCSPCQKVLEYDVGALTAHIFSTGHGNKTWELNNQSSTGSGKVVNAQHKVKEKAPRSSDDLIDFNDPQPVTEKKPAVNESTASDLVTGLPPVHEKQLNAVEEFDSLVLYTQSIVDTIYFDLMQYTVVVNARIYPYIQRRLAKCYCLICRMEMDPLFVSSHCMGTKHTHRCRDGNCLEILTKFHDIFMRLSPEQQTQQIYFKPGNTITCLPCGHVLLSTIECVQQHLGTDRHHEQVAKCGVSLKSNEKNVKVKNAIKKKAGVLRRYPEAIMEMVYPNLEQYTFNAKGSSYLYMQNRIGTKYCLLCQKPVHAIAEHIKSDEHSNNETNIGICEFVQRYHILFLNVADQLQFNQIHFKPQAGSIKCLKCLSSCSTTVELMQHLQSDKHYQLIAMEGTDDSIKSLEEIDESPLNSYSENTMNTIYRDLAQYIIGINNFLYPYIQHRSDGFYCLICSKAVSQLSEIEAHNSSDKHVDNYQDLYRLQAVSHYHEVFMRLSPEHQKQQIYFELCDYQMVCLPCATLCPYLREFVREHLKSVEHNEQLAIYKSKKGKVKLPESSATANNKELSLRTYCKNAMCTMYANLEQYTVVIKEVKYLYMQNRDMLKYCLLCVKYLENINDHVMSDEHRANEGDAKALKLVKMFHDFFLPLHKNLQLHQICFEPQADGVRCLKCECFCPSSLELKSHLQSESHNNVVGNLLLSDVVRLKNANVKDGKVCALRKAYPKTVKKTVYKRLQQYTVAIGNVEYFYIQIRGATKYCLICRSKVKDVPAHILSCEHLYNQADVRLLDAVKEYHNIFLSLKNELPIQQICFVPETGGVRCMKCGLSYSTPSHVALHIQTDEHNVLYIDQSEDKCNVSNGNCSKIIELNNFDLVIKRARKEYCILCECIDEQNHIRTDKHIAKCFGNNGAPLSLSRKALAFLKRWNELGTMYESMRNDFLPASAALTFCLKCGLNVEYNMLENHLLQFHTGVFHHFSEKLSPNAHQPKTPYSQNILDTCFKSNISQCNIVVDTISYPIILNMPDGLFCLLCRKMVNEHVHSHLTSDFHRNLIFESQPAKRKFFQYHDIWTSVSNEYQQQMVHFNNGSSFLCYCTLCATGIRNKELKLHLDSLEHVSALDFNKLKANMQLRKQQKSQRQDGDTLASNTADSSELSGSVLSTRSECDPPNKKQVIVSLDRLQISSLFEENPFVDNHAVLEEEMENESAVEGCDVIEDDFLPGHAYPREANDFIRKLHRLDVDVMQSTPNGKLFCLLCQSEVRKLVTHASLPQHEIKASHRSADVECIRVFHREWKKVDVLKRWLEATFFPVALTLAFCKKCGFNVKYSCLNNHLTKCHDNLLDIEFHLKLDEDFHFISKKEYCAKVRKTIYKDNVPQCDVILEGVSYPVIQTLDDNLRCLLCRKEIPDRAYDHLNSTEHISNAVNVVTRRRLKSYHDTWLDGDEDFQMQQIYFEKDRDYYCKICVVDLKATELREHIMNGFHGTSLKKFLINEHILHKLNMFHDVGITPQPDTSKAIVQSSRHSLMCEPRANDSGTEDSDDDDRNYSDSFVEEYYPQFDKYYVTINNIRYPIFRNTVAGCVCMICKRSPRTHIIEVHAEKDSHKSRMTNPTRQNKLRTFHKVWMKQNSSVQEHQKYFNQSKCLACNLQIDYDDIAVHVESEKHLQKISLPLNLSDVSGSMESLNPSSSISNSSTPVRSRSVQNENGVVQVPVPLGTAAAAIKPLIPPSAANNKKMYHSIRRSVPNSNGLSIIEMIPYRYSKQTRFLIIDKVKNIFCECCSKKLKNDIISIKEHLDSDNHLSLSKVPRNKMKYFCEICNKHYSMESSWDNHLIDLTHTARFNNLGKTRKERITEYECSNCNLVIFGDEISLQRHNTGYQKKKVKELVLPKPVLQLLTSKSYIEGNSKDLLIEANNASQNQDKERQVCVALVKVLKEKFPMCKAYPFGSRVTGLGYCDSDLDVFLDIGDMYQGSHHQGADEQAGIVNVVAKTLEKHKKSFSDINKVAGARTPIVQVFHKESNIDCDISFRHGLSVENTAFIRLCLDLQTILRPTMLYLKEWYAVTNITGISSYALTMLMIFYLQTTGYLLSVKELRVINAEKGTVIDGWETIKYTLSLQRMKEYINRCDYTVAQLMENFFEYYAKFDFEKWVVCPLMGFLVEKSHFNGNGAALPVEMEKYVEKLKNRDPEYFRNLTPICVQDPFDLSHNVTKACSRDMQKKFQAYCSLSKNHLSALK